ncbi:protein NRT1/ PTR FAMILY 5.5-like isoform X2 [Fagus crenata]
MMWADVLTMLTMFGISTYLINVWSLTVTHVATIGNVFNGVFYIMPIGMSFLVDTYMGDKRMLLLSSIANSIGMSFLAMSTPPVLSNAAGNCGAYKPECIGDAQKVLFYTSLPILVIGISGHLASMVSFLKLQHPEQTARPIHSGKFYIHKWHSPLPTLFRDYICAIPMWMTFIMCGVVISLGNTYFLAQANNLNRKVGTWKFPLPIFLVFYNFAKNKYRDLPLKFARKAYQIGQNIVDVASTGILMAMLFSILCCIVAAGVEICRLDVIRRYGLLDKPNEEIPMSMFLLLPQFILFCTSLWDAGTTIDPPIEDSQ